MAIYDFDTFADYCAGVLTSGEKNFDKRKSDSLADFPLEMREYVDDYLRGTRCFNFQSACLRFARTDRNGKITAVIFRVFCDDWCGWFVLYRCSDGASAKKFDEFDGLWNDLRDRELHGKGYCNIYPSYNLSTEKLLKMAQEKEMAKVVEEKAQTRENLLSYCAIALSYCSPKKRTCAMARAVCLSKDYEKLFGTAENRTALRAIVTDKGRVICAVFTHKNRLHVLTRSGAYDVKLTDGLLKAVHDNFGDTWLAGDCFFQKRLEKVTA